MRTNYLQTAVLCLVLIVCGKLQGQQLPDSVMRQYNNAIPQEKLYVHFDNNIYLPGESIWYKLYLQSTKGASSISSNVYIDWIDDNGKIITRSSAPVIRSTTWGSFEIPANYSGNKLHAIAYTQWMLNFDSSLIFHKELMVAQGAASSDNRTTITSDPVLKFFPEGGDLVATVASTVAFKALNADGMPLRVTGNIVNKAGQQVASFTTVHDGMGKLNFTPLPGESYTAEWKDGTGATYRTQLPAAKTSGIVFTVKEGSLDRLFTIEWSKDIASKTNAFTLVAHANQHVLFRAKAALAGKQKISGYFPLGRFPSGVITLTVLDDVQQPLAERIVFVNNEEYRLNAEIRTDTVGLSKKQKNVFEVVIPDSLTASLSLAITDGDLLSDSSNTIISGLLLSAEIKGHIHNPSYYFMSDEDSVKQQIDLVMLTNGWRRFAWEKPLQQAEVSLKHLKEDQFFSLTGYIKQTNARVNQLQKINSVNLIFQAKDSSSFFATVPLDQDKRFDYRNFLLFDTVTVFYQMTDELKGRTTVNATSNLLPMNSADRPSLKSVSYTRSPIKPVTLPSIYKAQPYFGQTTLAEVTVTGIKSKAKTRIEELNDSYTTGMFKQGDAYQLDLTEDQHVKASTNLFTYLQAKVAGLRVKYEGGEVELLWRGINSFAGPSTVAVLINEIQVRPSEALVMPMTDIAYVKVFRPPFLGVPLGNGGAGAIAVYTRKGDDRKHDFTGIDKFSVAGYTPVKEFYSPDYGEKGRTYDQGDVRRTLFWKPDILSDATNNKHRIVFYNNDLSKSLRVVLEGMTEDGKLVHITRLLQ